MTLDLESLEILREAVERLESGFDDLPGFSPGVDADAVRAVMLEVAERMKDNYPYPHPLYAGQMLTPPHTIARLAYMLSMWINPNNHALDGGRASSAMEKEAVAEIASMFGWKSHLGHLCGGGTMANLEALWVSKRLSPGKKIAASEQAHYTHARLSEVIGLPFVSVPCDNRARMDLNALEGLLQTGEIGTVVATMGTTATGSVDPLAELLELQTKYGFRIHADAAYGGYFTLASTLDGDAQRAFDCLSQVDSIAIDPHKHGLQPYGCGCILFKDPAIGALYKHNSPYTYFTSAALHLGEISLECSRPGASAVALWATQRLYPLVTGGSFAANLDKCRLAAKTLFHSLQADSRFMTAFMPELDIVIWAPHGESASKVSALTREVFECTAEQNLHLAIANLPATLLRSWWPSLVWDQNHVSCLRSCLLKPEHLDWMPQIWDVLDKAMNRVQVAG
jgi:glutamate/tyrosine decarboxylase-like PLP-dependent enzyme